MGTKTSYFLAALVAGGLGYWMYSGELVMGGQGDDPDSLPPPAERVSAAEEQPMAVRVREVTASIRQNALSVRGRAEAGTRVEVRTEAPGQVTEVSVAKGDRVRAGDELCRIDEGARQEQLSQAEAQLRQAEFDYDSNVTLAERGVVAEARVRTAKTALDAARAGVAQAKLEMQRVAVKAPIDGIVEDPLAELGDVLSVGTTCATIVQTDPMLAMGQVSERDVALLENGMAATVTPIGGEAKEGRVTYIAPSAEASTRTFRVEVSVPNADGVLRDGMTSTISIPLAPTRAHALSASTLTLNDNGVIGVRTVDENDTVVFMPVKILADSREGVWVTGLPETVEVITVGQEYVAQGAKVRPMPDERKVADVAPEATPPGAAQDGSDAAPTTVEVGVVVPTVAAEDDAASDPDTVSRETTVAIEPASETSSQTSSQMSWTTAEAPQEGASRDVANRDLATLPTAAGDVVADGADDGSAARDDAAVQTIATDVVAVRTLPPSQAETPVATRAEVEAPPVRDVTDQPATGEELDLVAIPPLPEPRPERAERGAGTPRDVSLAIAN